MSAVEAPAGRAVLLVGSYSPLFLVAGVRAWPHPAAVAACALAGIGLVAWAYVIRHLKTAQPRVLQVEDASPIDGEVTAYIVSLLLPAVAAGTPSGQDWAAYGICGALILVVAWGANLWSVNPVVYLFGLRVIRLETDGKALVALARSVPAPGSSPTASSFVGVTFIHNPSNEP